MIKTKVFLESFEIDDTRAVERLTALWALNECALGGVMHAFRLPFTGILVGGLSVLLITLIALFAQNIWPTLIKSLTIVLLIKLAVSPYTPIPAYFAVSFQAFLGILLYRIFSINKVTIVALCVLTFLESALQKLFTLTIIFGQSFWNAVDVYLDWVANQFSFLAVSLTSKTLIYAFLGVYIFSGFVAGFLIIKTIKLVELATISPLNIEFDKMPTEFNSKKKSKKKNWYYFLIILILVLLPMSYLSDESQAWQKAMYLVFRSLTILIIWYTLFGPFLLKVLYKTLSKKRVFYQADLQNIETIVPSLKLIVYHSWNECRHYKGFNRMSQFLAKSIVYSLYFDTIKK